MLFCIIFYELRTQENRSNTGDRVMDNQEISSYVFDQDGNMIPCCEQEVVSREISYAEHLKIQAEKGINNALRKLEKFLDLD